MFTENFFRVIAKMQHAVERGEGVELSADEAKDFIETSRNAHQSLQKINSEVEQSNNDYFPSTIGGEEPANAPLNPLPFVIPGGYERAADGGIATFQITDKFIYLTGETLAEIETKLAEIECRKLNDEIFNYSPFGNVQHFKNIGFVQPVAVAEKIYIGEPQNQIVADVRPREQCVEVQYFLNKGGWRDEELTAAVQEFDGVRGDSDVELSNPDRLRSIEFYFLTLEDAEAAYDKIAKIEGIKSVRLRPRLFSSEDL